MTIDHPGATSQKNAIVSGSLLKECIDSTRGARMGRILVSAILRSKRGWKAIGGPLL